MSRLNQPRTIPYDFQVFEMDDYVWLYDESSRTYACSQVALVWCEPLYRMDPDEWDLPDPGYYEARIIQKHERVKVPVALAADVPEAEAWDDAREEAQANCLL